MMSSRKTIIHRLRSKCEKCGNTRDAKETVDDVNTVWCKLEVRWSRQGSNPNVPRCYVMCYR